jgi:hypothetical protein
VKAGFATAREVCEGDGGDALTVLDRIGRIA